MSSSAKVDPHTHLHINTCTELELEHGAGHKQVWVGQQITIYAVNQTLCI